MTDHASALEAMRDKRFMRTAKYQEQQWRAIRDGVHPELLDFMDRMVVKMRAYNVPMFVHAYARNAEAQQKAYDDGFSKAKPGQSAHGDGEAGDLIHSTKGWELDKRSWALVGHIGKQLAASRGLEIVWGGDFKSIYDPAHWELANWRINDWPPTTKK